MKKEKVYAAFLKEAFLKPDEAVSGKRLERQLRQLQKGKDVRPKQEAPAALEEFLKEKQLEPTGKAGTVRHPIWKPAIAAVVVAVMVGSAGLYARQNHLKGSERGSESIGLECSAEKDASSWQETVMDSPPAAEAVLPTLEDVSDMTAEAISARLKGTKLSVLRREWGGPQQELPDGIGVAYYLPDGERALVLYISNETQTVMEAAILKR